MRESEPLADREEGMGDMHPTRNTDIIGKIQGLDPSPG